MQRSFLSLLFVGCLLFLAACHKIPEHANYIPRDAQVVASIDLNKMGKKLLWNALTGSELFKEMMKQVKNESSKSAMKDLSKIGLKQNSSVYLFSVKHSNTGNMACALAGMENKATFEKFIQTNYAGKTIGNKTNYAYCKIEDGLLTAWNNDVAYFFPLPGGNLSAADSMYTPPTTINAENEIMSQLDAYFSLKSENAITSNAHFKDLLKEEHDVSIWANYEAIFDDYGAAAGNPMLKKDYFKDAALATGIDFEKGEINAVMDYFMSKEMADIYRKNPPKNLDGDMIKHIPSDKIAFLAGYQLNVKMVQDYLKHFGMDGLVNMGLGLMGTSVDQIGTAFKGDMLFAVTDVAKKDTTGTSPYDSFAYNGPDMNFTMALKNGDKSAVENLLSVGVKKEILFKNGNHYTMKENEGKGDMVLSDDYLVYSTNASYANAFATSASNKTSGIPSDVMKQFSSNPMSLYLNINHVINAVDMSGDTPEEKEFIQQMKAMFTYAEMHGGQMKKSATHMEGKLDLSNKNENALIQLLNLGMLAKKATDSKSAPQVPADSNLVQ